MGNREDLIEGAKACLRAKGYLRTTARDIASVSGVSLAAIGYHFGTKDALLNVALHESLREWGEALFAPTDEPRDFADVWRRIIASFPAHRPIWATQFELAAQSDAALKEFLRARAIENQCFVLAAGQSGDHDPGRSCFGRSMVVDPWGTVLAQAADGSGLAVADLDLARLGRIRTQLPSLANRRLAM